jgi:hypothetical protein
VNPIFARLLSRLSPQALPMPAMRCDGTSGLDGGEDGFCYREPKRAPRIILPSRTPHMFGHRPIRIMTTLHFCDGHRGGFDVGSYWTDKVKARAEKVAREIRPFGFRPDFDRSRLEMVLITTPEYRLFLLHTGGLMATREFIEAQKEGGAFAAS